MSTLAGMFQRQQIRQIATAVRGRIATSPTTWTDDLFVTIGSFDGHRQQWGPCVWAPRIADVPGAPPTLAIHFPVRGDDCLVVFDEDELPWVVMWCKHAEMPE